MADAPTSSLKPRLLQGRRLLLTVQVIHSDDFFPPPDGWLDPVEVALYTAHMGCSLASATGERRYSDFAGRDEVLWASNALLQNVQLRPEWGLTPPHTLDLTRLATLVNRFVKGSQGMIRPNHPPATLGLAMIPAHGLLIQDPETGVVAGPLSTQPRVVVQATLAPDVDFLMVEHLRTMLLTPAKS